MKGLQAELPQEAAQASAWVADGGRHLCPFGDDAIDLGLRENPGASVNEPSDCAEIRERRYRRSRILVKRDPSCHVPRGNGRASVLTVGNSGAARRWFYRRSRFPAQNVAMRPATCAPTRRRRQPPGARRRTAQPRASEGNRRGTPRAEDSRGTPCACDRGTA